MIAVTGHHANLCRICTARIGAMIRNASDAFIARLWITDPATPPKRAARRDVRMKVDALFEEFKRTQVTDDARAHLDLARAYGEMGLTFDAIRSAGSALHESAPLSIARLALEWLFARNRAEPGALETLIDGARTS
jgi:hypothetical protein